MVIRVPNSVGLGFLTFSLLVFWFGRNLLFSELAEDARGGDLQGPAPEGRPLALDPLAVLHYRWRIMTSLIGKPLRRTHSLVQKYCAASTITITCNLERNAHQNFLFHGRWATRIRAKERAIATLMGTIHI